MYLIFILTVVCIIGVATIYLFIIIPSRVFQYKKLAEELKAEYAPQEESNAKISGSINGRKYSIQTLLLGSRLPSGAYYRFTKLSVDCVNNGIPLLVNKRFFLKNFPDWREIFTKGDKKERVLGAYINLKDISIPIEDKYRPKILSIFQRANETFNNYIKRGNIAIDATTVSFISFGVMVDLEKIKRILSFLCVIAQNIENAPVID